MEVFNKVERALESARADLPDHVVDTRFELDVDWTGDDCVRIWLILDDDASDDAWEISSTNALRDTVRRALVGADVSLWPFISVRAKSEQDDLDAWEAGYRTGI